MGQESDATHLKYARQAAKNGDLKGKAYYLNIVLQHDSSSTLLREYAETLVLLHHYSEAVLAYETIQKAEQLETLEHFTLALLYKNIESYDKAEALFKAYLKLETDRQTVSYRQAKNELKYWPTLDALKNGEYHVQHLGDSVNSILGEFAPTLLQSKLAYFTRTMPPIEKNTALQSAIYRLDTLYNDAVLADSMQWTDKGKYANLTHDSGNGTFYYTYCEKYCFIYAQQIDEAGHWLEKELLPEPINLINANSTQPYFVSNEGKDLLYFVSDREDGKGGFDIYVAERKGKSNWKVSNLGTAINTKGNEVTPSFNAATNSLVFSSDFHFGLGGYDIFKSSPVGKKWTTPENLRAPLNSSTNDLYAVWGTENSGYFATNRKGSFSDSSGTCCNDIWQFASTPFEAPTEDTLPILIADTPKVCPCLAQLKTHAPVLYFHNDEPNPRTSDSTTVLSYSDALASYLLQQSRYMKATNDKQAIEDFFELDVNGGMQDLEAFTKIIAEHIALGNKFTLTIKGYASPLAKSDYNRLLTMRRIESLINYWKTYENGMLAEAIRTGKLAFVKQPFGEETAAQKVSDKLEDTSKSVYSIDAAYERRIEVISIEIE